MFRFPGHGRPLSLNVKPALAATFRFLLRLVRVPFVLPTITFYILFHVAETYWCALYDWDGLWQPAFPYSWIVWALFLVAAPLNAALWLGGLLSWRAACWGVGYMKARRSVHLAQNGSPVLRASEDEYLLISDTESAHPGHERQPSSPTTSYGRRRNLRLPAVWWWAQVALYASIALAGAWQAIHYAHPNDVRFRHAVERASRAPTPEGYGKGEKIFIAAAFYNNHVVLPYWKQSMLSAIAYLGPENVFVSIVESHSSDDTPELLRDFDASLAKMHVPRRIIIQDAAIEKPEDLSFDRRIEFLAAVRNRAMEPLVEHGGYDKVLFSNDVFIEPESIVELIETADGEYDFACAMDFNHFGAYDSWVLRDRLGHLTSTIWPYFIDKPSIELMRQDAPVPAFTCWNGMVVFTAEPLLPIHLRPNRTLSPDPLPWPLPRSHPLQRGPSPALTPALRFRKSDRAAGECFESESFNLPYDFRRVFGLNRVLVNPRVVTSYDWRFYVWFKWVLSHRLVRWWVRDVYDGWGMERKKMIVGVEERVWVWDGGDCHPWW
ncbi:cryptococcal mannosyltransferase 1-domain-containing protein [Fomitopsis serialis]|uniref:cryptococcal mannosyltransferase 1-domain-containing protein n=1 Tax=Fomitopsis serialis TaxID=139415 RepID=UPI002007817C|nr:cryptococcal mannosyltransferase 1-domain-containing protein [Neoantrodia serialis]KAH9932887.1 cryptococcal mannosyltransferase 1-domain-containing protein [Neoantrodia serialis]